MDVVLVECLFRHSPRPHHWYQRGTEPTTFRLPAQFSSRVKMSSSCYKTIYASLSSGEQTSDAVGLFLNQGGCVPQKQGQVLGSEIGLMDMTDVEYSHLQHFLHAHMDVQAGPPDGPDTRVPPATVIVTDTKALSPLTSTQAIDLSTSNDDHYEVMSGEKTPVSYGEVPSSVLARIRSEESLSGTPVKGRTSSEKHSRSTTRVCLEKRFNSMCTDTTREQDIHSAVLSNLLTALHQSSEAQEKVIQPQKMCVKADRANGFEFSSNYVGGVFDPIPNMCSQVIAHVVEPNKHQGLIIPSFAFNFHPETILTKTLSTKYSNLREEQQLVNTQKDVVTPAACRNHCSDLSSQPTKSAKGGPVSVRGSQGNSSKRAQSYMSLSQRREIHNKKERERRKRIRLCCDELNTMVPFCDSDTDKVTTLQWTTAFLRYINKTYGNTFKEEFQKIFTKEKRIFHQKMNETLSIPLRAEQ